MEKIMAKNRKPEVEWRCTKDYSGAWSCLGHRNGKRTLVSMYSDGVVNIIGKKIKCNKASIMQSDVMICGSEITSK